MTFFVLLGNSKAQETQKTLYRANKLFQEGNYTGAEPFFREVLKQQDTASVAWFNLGNTLYRQQNYEQAGNAYIDAVRTSREPDLKQKAFYNLGLSWIRQKKLQESIDAWKKAVIQNPADEDARFNLQKALEEWKKQQQPEKKQNNAKKQPEKESKKPPPPNKKMMDQWLQSLRQKEQEVQKKMQQNRTRSASEPDKDW